MRNDEQNEAIVKEKETKIIEKGQKMSKSGNAEGMLFVILEFFLINFLQVLLSLSEKFDLL